VKTALSHALMVELGILSFLPWGLGFHNCRFAGVILPLEKKNGILYPDNPEWILFPTLGAPAL
jgi:hypothetical protein